MVLAAGRKRAAIVIRWECAMEPKMHNHDVVVIGASAGGLQATEVLIAALPAKLRAAVFIVMHIGRTSYLAEILHKVSNLPVSQAANGEAVEPGRIYVAPPERHLLLHDSHILLRRGPRENLVRPAIDPLFRSAAASFGGRVIGIILSGALNDGTAGLRAIKRCGGIAIVQDPDDARVPEMPLSALKQVDVDCSVPIARMGEALLRFVAEPAGATPAIPIDVRLEAAIAAQELGEMVSEDGLGEPASFSCPECQGTLWEIDDPSVLRYRCRVGHAFTAETVLGAKSDEVDGLL
jgi:two-component system chemotaxis response regulator CheB